MTQNNSDYDLEKEEYYILGEENRETDNPNSYREYEISDDEENEDNPDNQQTSEIEDNSGGENGITEEKVSKPNPILLLLSMMINPIEGWKNIRRSGLTTEEISSRCFYPLVALASLSEFMCYIYTVPDSVSTVLIEALSVFISFFFGYFVITLLEKSLLPANCRETALSQYGREYILYLLSTLTLFYTLSNFVPMLEAVWVFMPLWTIYLASKGIRFFKFPDKRITLITVMMCAFIILTPIAIYMIFSELLMM